MDQPAKKTNASDHLANERTLLAWVRTGVGVMAFGFVVVKFSLFVRQIGLVIGNKSQIKEYGYSGPIGIILVAAGALSLLLALMRYRQTEKQLNNDVYRQSSGLIYGLVIFVFITGLLLMAYLIKST